MTSPHRERDPEAPLRASARLKELMAEHFAAVDRAARGRDSLLPPILAAVRAQVTLGEICDTLRRVFGTHQPSVVF